jgi:hypothetical protein
MKCLRLFLGALLFGNVCLLSGHAEYADVVAKARAYLGTEAALNAVQTIHYSGTLETVDDVGGVAKPLKLGIEIFFRKPFQQRIVVTTEKSIETTALDGYEAWQRQQDPTDLARWQVKLLSPDQIKRLRANASENLAFFRGIETRGGAVVDQGEAEVEGVKCRKLAFVYEPTIAFIRYFNPASGKLVLTETEQGGKIREEGEVIVKGVRFPQKIITINKVTEGKERVVTISFEKVEVNEVFANDFFRVPMMWTQESKAKESAKADK